MSAPLRILLIAYAVPPSIEVGGNRIARFCKYLPEYGIDPVVLTVESRFYKQIDHASSLPPATLVARAKQNDTALDWYANWKSRRKESDLSRASSARVMNTAAALRLRQHLVSALCIPDQYRGWQSPATLMGRQLLREQKFDAIVSSSPPQTVHRVARSLKKEYHIPWIADFRDPWVTDEPSIAPPFWWRQKVDAQMEKSCVALADLVVCNTDWLNRAMSARYKRLPKDKFATLTNGFDDIENPLHLDLNKHKPLRCLHLGAIYGGRRIDTFCEGLSILLEKQLIKPDVIKTLFVGLDGAQVKACRQMAGKLIDSGVIEFRERVDNEEKTRHLSDADLLLVFSGNRTQLPSKFYEYLATGKPIFAVTQPGALSDLIDQTSAGIWANEGDPSNIAEKFLSALDRPAQSPEYIQKRWAERFHFRSLTRQLARWIRALVEKQGVKLKAQLQGP